MSARPKRRERLAALWRRPAILAIAVAMTLAAAGGIAQAGLKDRIDSAENQAEALSEAIEERSGRISALEGEAAQAQSRVGELTALLGAGVERSSRLSVELGEAERALRESQARLDRAKGVLAERLVAIYKGADPDYLDLVLESADFEDLTSRADYLRAIEEADATIVERVEALNDEVVEGLEQVTDAKAAVDDHNRELVAARAEVASLRASLEGQSARLAEARSAEEATLDQLRSKIDTWQAELGAEQTAALFGDGGWAIPAYIVMCESGGNFRAYNPSSGAGGAYQIIPSTWRSYGGKGLAHTAPPAEQHRIAAMIWRDSGPSAWSCA